MAELTGKLQQAGVTAIGFDMVFSEPDRTSPLAMVEAWLGPSGWSDAAGRYVSSSYRLSIVRSGDVAPADVDAPSVRGAAWPFDGPIERFGGLVFGQERCGYLDLGQAFETLRLMRALGVPSFASGEDPPPELSLDRFGYGNFSTDAGWFGFGLTPRRPDGFPACNPSL